jgi:CRISPR/Cas system CSM-associated protein Csm3 (group 7 of RAMP superfamily)
MNKEKVMGRFLICGKLRLRSLLLIGTGEKANSEITILKDDEGKPYIPASSMNGALRHYFYENIIWDDADNEQAEFFWGSDKQKTAKNTYQSAFILQDLYAVNNAKITVRDGIEIDNKKGIIAKDGGKFAYEVVEPGTEFVFNGEVVVREKFSGDMFLKIITTMIKALKNGEVAIGAMTTKGFGRCNLIEHSVYKYDFCGENKARDAVAWLKNTLASNTQRQDQLVALDFKDVFSPKCNNMSLTATFSIKSSLIVRSYSGVSGETDAEHMTSGGKDVIPGTSIKGALRARAEKIINTLGKDGFETVKELFGWAPNGKSDEKNNDDKDNDEEKLKSRFIVEDAYIENAIKETQYRVKIDRFTGGAIKTGLFDSIPVWSVGESTQVTINMKINNCKDWEAGLTLLLLKDLWTGDLPLGGEKSIGRGVLEGISAKMSFNGKDYQIKNSKENNLDIDGDKPELEKMLQAFVGKCRCEEARV